MICYVATDFEKGQLGLTNEHFVCIGR